MRKLIFPRDRAGIRLERPTSRPAQPVPYLVPPAVDPQQRARELREQIRDALGAERAAPEVWENPQQLLHCTLNNLDGTAGQVARAHQVADDTRATRADVARALAQRSAIIVLDLRSLIADLVATFPEAFDERDPGALPPRRATPSGEPLRLEP